jgi:hypothetical protein
MRGLNRPRRLGRAATGNDDAARCLIPIPRFGEAPGLDPFDGIRFSGGEQHEMKRGSG